MRRVFAILCMLLCATSLSAQSAHTYLDELERSLGGRYAFTIAVQVGDAEDMLYGRVMVDGDSYYMSLEGMEVYSDGELRYEINNERKEIVEDRVNLLSEDILTNPTRVFAYFDKEFEVRGITHQGSLTTIDLAPRNPDLMGDYSVSLTVERTERGVEPRHLYYDYDGYVVDLALEVLHQSDAEFRHWKEHKMEYRAYDMISFL